MTAKRAVLLARVSTKAQGDNYSLPSQLEAMRAYCQKHGFEIVEEVTDIYTGNSAVAERPGGAKVYDYLRRKAVEVVLLYTLDRTARDDDAIEYAIFKRDVRRAGAELHFADTGKTADDLFGGLIEQFKAAGAAEERRKIAERNMRGRYNKVKGVDGKPGRWVGCGHAPYGYRTVGKGKHAVLQFSEQEIRIARRIFDMYLGLNGYEPMNMTKIASILEAEGIPAPHRGRRSSKGWWTESVRLILINPRYKGEFRFADIVNSQPELAIISEATFRAVQERRVRNSWQSSRNRKHEYLLAGGYQRCSCGRSMRGVASYYYYQGKNAGKKKYVLYYVCHREKHLIECNEKRLRADVADKLVWGWLSGSLKDDVNLDIGIKHMIERRDIELSPKRERLESVQELIAEQERSIRNLSRGLSKAENDTVADVIAKDLQDAGQRLKDLTEERDVLLGYIQQGGLTSDEIETIKRIAAELRAELSEPDFETKRYLIDRLNVRSRLRNDDSGRWLDLTCEIAIEPDNLSVASTSTRRC